DVCAVQGAVALVNAIKPPSRAALRRVGVHLAVLFDEGDARVVADRLRLLFGHLSGVTVQGVLIDALDLAAVVGRDRLSQRRGRRVAPALARRPVVEDDDVAARYAVFAFA